MSFGVFLEVSLKQVRERRDMASELIFQSMNACALESSVS